VSLTLFGIDPMRALFWSAVVNGIVAVPLMFLLMLMSHNKAIVGKFTLPRHLNVVGWIATLVMFLASVFFAVSSLLPKQ
jgi:Mn2+/Fe2+ NRAMP family transporter